jgi:hypothetical protein
VKLQGGTDRLGTKIEEAASARGIPIDRTRIVPRARGYENNITCRQRRIFALGEKKPLTLLADAELVAIVIVEDGKILGVWQTYLLFIAKEVGIRGKRIKQSF